MAAFAVLTHVARMAVGARADNFAWWSALMALDGVGYCAERYAEITAVDPTGAMHAARAQEAFVGFLGGLVLMFAATVQDRRHLKGWEIAAVLASWAVVLRVFIPVDPAQIRVDPHPWWLGGVSNVVQFDKVELLILVPVAVAMGRGLTVVLNTPVLSSVERALLGGPLLVVFVGTVVDHLGRILPIPYMTLLPFGFMAAAVGLGLAGRLQTERLLAERTAALAQRNLALDRAVAEGNAARETRALFIANVSHELRTPVNGVVGLASLLADTRLDSHQRELLGHLEASGRAMRVLVDDVLDFSRIDAGKVNLNPDWVDVRVVIAEVFATVAHAAYANGLGLEARVGVDVPAELYVDGTRLGQVLLNLVGNAIKFTREGAVTVGVNWEEDDGDEGWLRCEVSDTGMGMDPRRLAHLFEPFVQGDPSATRAHGGSGLGLSISRELARAMGGELEAESAVGVGSVFHVSVVASVRENRRTWRLPLPRGTRVLVLDWDGLFRFAVEPMLASCGATVSWRRSISEVGADEYFDLILDGALALPVQVERVRKLTGARWIACPRLDDRMEWPRAIEPDAVLYRPVLPARLYAMLAGEMGSTTDFDFSPRANRQPPVLVVDDNAINLLVAVRLVERLGHPVYAARDGREALDLLERSSVDLILMDCQMPGMDGFEATRRIRARYGRHHRILALTASALDADRLRAIEAGMNGYLVKPVDLDHLQQALRGADEEQRSTASSHSVA